MYQFSGKCPTKGFFFVTNHVNILEKMCFIDVKLYNNYNNINVIYCLSFQDIFTRLLLAFSLSLAVLPIVVYSRATAIYNLSFDNTV